MDSYILCVVLAYRSRWLNDVLCGCVRLSVYRWRSSSYSLLWCLWRPLSSSLCLCSIPTWRLVPPTTNNKTSPRQLHKQMHKMTIFRRPRSEIYRLWSITKVNSQLSYISNFPHIRRFCKIILLTTSPINFKTSIAKDWFFYLLTRREI